MRGACAIDQEKGAVKPGLGFPFSPYHKRNFCQIYQEKGSKEIIMVYFLYGDPDAELDLKKMLLIA